MKNIKLGVIALAITSSLLFGMMSSSQAAEITSLSVYANPDYGSGTNLYPSLTADEDIMYIDWYVKQTYPKIDADSDYEHVHTSMHSHGTRSVSLRLPQSYDGHIKIAAYDIKAKVCFDNQIYVSATTTVDVYRPVYEGGYKKTGVYGYSELTAHYFNGSSIVMDGFAWAYNGTGDPARITGRFRHTALNKPLDELERELPGVTLKDGEFVHYTTSDWGETFFHFNTTLEDGEEWHCDAYLRIHAGIGAGKPDNWWATDQNWFDRRDHR